MTEKVTRVSGTRLAALVAGAAVLCVLPFLVSDYAVSQLNQYLFLVLAVLGLNVLSGFSGQISLGHGAFLAIGAYVAALCINDLGIHHFLTIPISAVVCFFAGLAIGFPALRLSGHYLALATFALSLAMPQVLKHKSIQSWTGGVQGVLVASPEIPVLSIGGYVLDIDRWFYFETLILTIIVFFLVWNLLRGRVGRALIALRDHSLAASTMGVNVGAYKAITFGVSASITGIAGNLIAVTTGFVAPDSFTVIVSISLLVGSVIGGIGSILGAPFGAIFIHYLPDFAQRLSNSAPTAVYGALLLVVVYVLPGGVAGLIRTFVPRRPRIEPKGTISSHTQHVPKQ
ncbi:MAG TPA: branched-chain amino acid ABC transporter permease [Bellilinea sp.]|nr:branched-chain amino acid ABC transporter permease [Bellilinea sp.]